MKHEIIDNILQDSTQDSPLARAEITRSLVKQIYDFVKFNRPEGEGFDGMTGPERESLGEILEAAENHYFNMLKHSHN